MATSDLAPHKSLGMGDFPSFYLQKYWSLVRIFLLGCHSFFFFPFREYVERD